MSERPGRAKLWGMWGAFAAILAVVLVVAWPRSEPTPPPPNAGDVVAEVAPAKAPAADGVAAPARGDTVGDATVRAEATQPGIYGRLLDRAGEPLVGYQLRVRRKLSEEGAATRWFEHAPMVSGADGSFAFRAKLGGDYTLSTLPFAFATRTVTMSDGEHVAFDFRLRAGEVATTGQVMRSGKVQKRVRVWLSGRNHMDTVGATDGVFRFVLPVGMRKFSVLHPATVIRQQVPCDQPQVLVPGDVARFDWTMHLQCSDVIVDVRDDMGRLPVGAEVTLRTLGEHAIYSGKISKPVAREGTVFACVPPGEYRVSVSGDSLVPVPAQKITIAQVHRRERLQFDIASAAMVQLLVRVGGRSLRSLPATSMPVLHAAGADFAYGKLKNRGGKYTGHEYGFQNVPLGRASVVAQDVVVADEWQFLAFDPIPEQFVDVASGRDNVLAVDVTRRALVDLRACESGGREQFSATIEVFAGDRKVRTHDVKGCQRFRSHLPPGDYQVRIDRGGKVREHTLVVARKDIRLRLRP